jgi:predicted 2-oxoglutarate/Fe(II)-dependent dioxygenase YbiX
MSDQTIIKKNIQIEVSYENERKLRLLCLELKTTQKDFFAAAIAEKIESYKMVI